MVWKPWFITSHAMLRMRQMGLDRATVVAAIEQPDVTTPAQSDRKIARRGDIAVVFEPAAREIVTVLWRGVEFRRPA